MLARDGKPGKACTVLFAGPMDYDGTKASGYESDLTDEILSESN